MKRQQLRIESPEARLSISITWEENRTSPSVACNVEQLRTRRSSIKLHRLERYLQQENMLQDDIYNVCNIESNASIQLLPTRSLRAHLLQSMTNWLTDWPMHIVNASIWTLTLLCRHYTTNSRSEGSENSQNTVGMYTALIYWYCARLATAAGTDRRTRLLSQSYITGNFRSLRNLPSRNVEK